jgi:hypothetical protein
MTGALILYADGSVRYNDLDLDRDDVVRALLDAPQTADLDLDDLRLRLVFDGLGLGVERPLNLAATILVYGTGRRPTHPIVGDVLVLGLTVDGDATDVPDDLLDLF